MKNLFKTAALIVAMASFWGTAHSQEVIPATQYEEQVFYPTPSGNAGVILPGQDLINDTMPSGPQTSHVFPEPSGEIYEENTTVIFSDE